MIQQRHNLNDGGILLLREAEVEDAAAILNYIAIIAHESDFLTFGPGEFEVTLEQEKELLDNWLASERHLYLLGLIEDTIVASLTFSAGRRPRVQHAGEFGMSVGKGYWGRGIGGLMLDRLIEWAKEMGVIKKINLRVRTDNERAIALYEKKGFLHEGTRSKEIYIEGRYYDHYYMGLEI
jgi:RimJ/RimL family protein N-acetyltransferase